MRSRRWTRQFQATALLCVIGMVGVACGSDDDGTADSTAATSPAAGDATTVPATSTESAPVETEAPATDDTSSENTTAESEGSAPATSGATADNPAAFGSSRVVEGGPYGQDADNPDLYVGAGGFELDMTACPEDYDVNQGISDTEIRLAHTLPKSGPLAGFGIITDGMSSYFEYVNETFGGIDGREIVLDFKDDAYEPAKTTSNVNEMLQSRQYAAFPEILGTANNLAVWDVLNDECMPQLVIGSGGAQWGDVENHPWSTGLQLDYFSEAVLWAEWLKEEFPDGAKVTMITFNNDYGKSYSGGFRSAIEGTNIELVDEELHEAGAPNLTNQFTSLAATNADVLLIQTSGAFCTQAMGEVEKGAWKPTVIMSATCASLGQYFKPLIDQGLTGAGTHVIQYYKDPLEPSLADDPYIKLYHDTLAAQGLDSQQTTYFTGWIFAWYTAEILKLATTLEGGLTRPNLVIANRSMETQYPGLIDGLTNRMEGLEDAYMIEGGRMTEYVVSDPTQLGTFEPAGDVINNEGALGTYATVVDALEG